ncbi:hypothetical protein Tsubulata_020864 [Turnera subulata]|uniref:TFIIS N-terminal domain-containing protein n=1 Tax=Turnera subulata TaxID=218843 RepID=A0A9Q0FA94_9ROSI|nr:hypothetical protein Tsubulata_020864 [Turnera subulata]
MDADDFRSVLETCGVDVWTFIDAAIDVAALDYASELKQRRDGIVEKLYATPSSSSCRNCSLHNNSDLNDVSNVTAKNNDAVNGRVEAKRGGGGFEKDGKRGGSPSTTPLSVDDDDDGGAEDEDLDPYGGLFDDEQKRILDIKQQIEDPRQTEDSLVDLLQSLADMDITFQALKETDIGRHVNRLRKHSSGDVRRLVKQLVRKWKEIVDEWVSVNPQGDHASSALMDGDSPQQKMPQNGHHQVPDFAYSPNPHNGSSGSDKNNSEPERKLKPAPSREAPARPTQKSVPASVSASHNVQRQKEQQREQQKQSNFDSERLASARRRLQESYKEAENAKRQRTIQMMDIHEIPKPKNAFFGKNRGGGSQGRHW